MGDLYADRRCRSKSSRGFDGEIRSPRGERSRRASQLDSSISAESAAKHRAVSDPTRARNHDIQPSARADIFPSTVSRNGGGNEGALD